MIKSNTSRRIDSLLLFISLICIYFYHSKLILQTQPKEMGDLWKWLKLTKRMLRRLKDSPNSSLNYLEQWIIRPMEINSSKKTKTKPKKVRKIKIWNLLFLWIVTFLFLICKDLAVYWLMWWIMKLL